MSSVLATFARHGKGTTRAGTLTHGPAPSARAREQAVMRVTEFITTHTK